MLWFGEIRYIAGNLNGEWKMENGEWRMLAEILADFFD